MKLPKLLDCTLRDGGYINNWDFSPNFGKALYRAASVAGVDYVEVGFFDPGAKSGLPWTNLSADDLRSIRGDLEEGTAIAVMINYGSVSLDDVPDAAKYPADLIRVAAPKSAAKEATAFAAALTGMGYRSTINYMGISNYSNREILGLVDLMNRFKEEVEYFYVADSFGSLMPKRTREIFATLRFGTDAALGFHPHNNLQLAFANCLEAMEAGVDIIDGSVFGMGRGAGNLFTDAMLAYFEQCDPERYHLVPILQFADLYMEAQKQSYNWGYSLPQLLSGVFHCHPNYPTNLLREKAYTADDIYGMLRLLSEEYKSRYSSEQLEAMKAGHISKLAESAAVACSSTIRDLCAKHARKALLVCGGNSVSTYNGQILRFIEQTQVSVFAVNNPQPPVPSDGVFFGNRRRVLQYFDQIPQCAEVIFGPEIHEGAEANFALSKVSRVNALKSIDSEDSPYPMMLPSNSAIEAILGLVQLGYQEIFICGLDGYTSGTRSHYYVEQDAVSAPEELEKQNALILEELRITDTVAERLGFTYSIITPTLFTDNFNSSVLK